MVSAADVQFSLQMWLDVVLSEEVVQVCMWALRASNARLRMRLQQ